MDIFNPNISKVTKGVEGKTILVYGTNRTGKTKVATSFEKPYYLPFENGLGGVSGVPTLPIQKWADFLKINKQLTNSKTLTKAREAYQTLIFDGVESSAMMCQDFICQKHDADSIKSGNEGYGLWSEYETEFKRQLDLLTGVGYTVIFISHEGSRKYLDDAGEEYSKIYPKGDKRSIDPICDLCDIIAYARVNNKDEDGNEVKSSLFLTNTNYYHAGSRFDYLPPFLKEFSAKNLEDAICSAVEKQEEMEKGGTATLAEIKLETAVEVMSFEDLKANIEKIVIGLHKAGRLQEYTDIKNEYLGADMGVKDATKKQYQSLEMIYNDIKEL